VEAVKEKLPGTETIADGTIKAANVVDRTGQLLGNTPAQVIASLVRQVATEAKNEKVRSIPQLGKVIARVAKNETTQTAKHALIIGAVAFLVLGGLVWFVCVKVL
jgi:hypothetical protein